MQKFDKREMENARPTPDRPGNVGHKRDKDMLRQILDSQISLEILLKHNELRLIDQEIAKCQIALEQLRRCQEIPYPFSRPSQDVSQGRGPAIRSSRSTVYPESPAPWGVTDGPYTRHYAKWLLPDPLFDGGNLTATKAGVMSPDGKRPTKGRSTRGSFADPSTPAGKSRIQRAGKFQGLSSGYPPLKDKAGPMIQKRKSDGLLVKLVCLDCRRDNFSSAQGFINHCRIAHSRSFASHDAAADACGEPVDVDESGSVVGGEGPSGTPMARLIHPLVYSAHLLKQETPRKTSDPVSNALMTALPTSASGSNVAGTPEHMLTSCLTPSSLTPNLSTLMKKQGANLDLESLVTEMKTSVPVGDYSESESENEGGPTVPDAPLPGRHPHVSVAMQPALCLGSSGEASAPSRCRKGLKPRPKLDSPAGESPIAPVSASAGTTSPSRYMPAIQCDTQEPSPTNDSNQAPSLVDDDGDDEYEIHSPSYSGSGSVDTESRELDFVIEVGDESGTSTQNRSTESDYSSTPKPQTATAPAGRASAFRRSISGREEKHVSFVNPDPGRQAEPSNKGDSRKRRKTGFGL